MICSEIKYNQCQNQVLDKGIINATNVHNAADIQKYTAQTAKNIIANATDIVIDVGGNEKQTYLIHHKQP